MEPTKHLAARECCDFSTRFDARLDAVPAAMHAVAEQLRRCGVADDMVERSELILEELFRNAVLHGYGGDCGQAVWVGVGEHDGRVAFWVEDAAPAFDPLSAHCAHAGRDLQAPAEQLEVGGVGLLLIRRLAADVRYSRQGGRNRTTVRW